MSHRGPKTRRYVSRDHNTVDHSSSSLRAEGARTGIVTVIGLSTIVAILTALAVLAAFPVAGKELGQPSLVGRLANAQAFSAQKPSEHLGNLSPTLAMEAVLDVEFAGDPAFDHAIRASLVESLWEDGRHAEALNVLRSLEDEGLVSGVGIAWRRPQPTTCPAKADVQVDGAGGADEIVLDYDPVSGNLFAVIRWGISWGLFISSDNGASWSESFHYSGIFANGMHVDLEVHNTTFDGDHAYVAYSYKATLMNRAAKAIIRRFEAQDGASDGAWGSHAVNSDPDRSFKEIAMVIDGGGAIFYTILRSDGVVLCLAGTTVNGSANWFNQSAGITDADRGLDVAYPGEGANHISLYISYIASDDRIKMVRRAKPTGFIQCLNVVDQPQPWADKTSVAAYLDHATVAWEFLPPGNTYQGVRTMNILEHGTSPSDIEKTDGIAWFTESHHLRDPLVAANATSLENAIVYTNDSSIFYRKHDSYGVQWNDPVQVVNDHDFTPGQGNTYAFEWLGQGYGIAYHDSSGNVYFVMQGPLFNDGFESGDLSAWS